MSEVPLYRGTSLIRNPCTSKAQMKTPAVVATSDAPMASLQGYLAHKKQSPWPRSRYSRLSTPYTGTFDPPLFLITYPYIAHCMGACSAKGEWSLFSLSLSLSSLSRLSTPFPPGSR